MSCSITIKDTIEEIIPKEVTNVEVVTEVIIITLIKIIIGIAYFLHDN